MDFEHVLKQLKLQLMDLQNFQLYSGKDIYTYANNKWVSYFMIGINGWTI